MNFFRFLYKYKVFRPLYSRYPVILLYHDVPEIEIIKGKYGVNRDVFDQHLNFISSYFEVVDYTEYKTKRRLFDKIKVILTFDDGFKNNFLTAVPILKKYSAKATFFISSRHIDSSKILWFQYLKLFSLFYSDADDFIQSLNIPEVNSVSEYREYLIGLENHPHSIYSELDRLPKLESFLTSGQIEDWAEGMTTAQVKEIAEDALFTIGQHTEDHPFLTKCSENEIVKQLKINKEFLEQTIKKKVSIIAYPIGDYNEMVINFCKTLNVDLGFAVYSQQIGSDTRFEIPRVGIYTTSTNHLGLKIIGSRLFLSRKIDWIKRYL